ncbi:hypothetical protein Goari_024377 [Gossypium aridum]|uniref:Uncharacterized protein n=1 Tax=Gossypium aridum TaxID=34290 RepID=A0A7J8X5Y7_GOSAI|nr:hypothetical protein [Gossypium aridum]
MLLEIAWLRRKLAYKVSWSCFFDLIAWRF